MIVVCVTVVNSKIDRTVTMLSVTLTSCPDRCLLPQRAAKGTDVKFIYDGTIGIGVINMRLTKGHLSL